MTIAGHTNRELLDRARRITAAEVYDIGTRFPAIITGVDGSWMEDVEGNRILDVTAASGALLFGNRHPKIVETINRYIAEHGVVFASTLTLPRIELAERLCDRYPAGEKAVFCKTGSEATTTAIRLARQASGRDLVITSGYHGWHDWQLSYLHMGFDKLTRTVTFGYNETVLRRLLEEHADRTAVVIVTPEPAWFDVAYYQRLSDLCAEFGVLFCIDEVITALRWGARGLNGTGGVPADLITVSKGLANGHSLAAVLGRRDVMDTYDAAGIAGTYTREVPPMAAALAVLDLVEDGSVHEHCEAMGTRLRDGMRDVLADVGVPAVVSGPPMMFDVVFPTEPMSFEVYRAAFDHGAWFEDSGTHMVTNAYGEAEVDHALTAFEKGLRKVAGSAAAGGPLPEERRQQFTTEAFGSVPDDERLQARLDELLASIGER